ncbi:sporulation-like protein [Nitratireductor pacificus pht-3B]|uniref:Sporulation-like protein n=2 Tax=Nitratireductor TaxID=245876 RepID=K2MYC4_9HYPH|nr:sporulation-like protein [Nitratireductor pacificus pht-3B]
MGHDPRRVDISKSDLDEAGDDLALELENELLGDLTEFSDAEPQPVAANDAWQPAENDWRFEAAVPEYAADAAPEDVSDEAGAAMSDALEDTFAASFEAEMRLDGVEEDALQPEMDIEEAPSEDWLQDGFSTAAEEEDASFHSEPALEEQVDETPIETAEPGEEMVFDPRDWAELDPDFAVTETAPQSAGEPYAPEDTDILMSAIDDLQNEIAVAGVAEPVASQSAARQYMSPQDFATSVARGSEQEPLAEGPGGGEALDLAAAFEAEFGVPDDPAPTLADDLEGALEDPASSWPFAAEQGEMEAEPESASGEPFEQPSARFADEQTDDFWRQPEPLQQPGQDGPPLIDTVDVPGDARVAVEEARHIPEFHSEPASGPENGADDLELALARAFGDAEGVPETFSGPAEKAGFDFPDDRFAAAAEQGDDNPQDDDFDFEDSFADEAFKGAVTGYETPRYDASGQDATYGYAAPDAGSNEDDGLFAADDEPWRGQASDGLAAQAAPMAAAPAFVRNRLPRGRNGALIAAAAGGVVLLGAVAMFAFGGGGGSDAEAPVLVRADSEPVKVKPENPGGQTVPNQDSQAYQRVTGAEAAGNPEQERLVSNIEEPVEVPAPQATPKSEERLTSESEQAVASTDEANSAMAPRRVRTMVVRPDGTLVPREPAEPAAQVAAVQPAPAPAAQQPQAPATAAQSDVVSAGAPQAAAEEPAPEGTAAVDVPSSAPVPTARPAAAPVQSQQPAAPAPAQVAAAPAQPAQPVAQQPAQPVAAAADGWSVQISSQPTAESAQQSYQDMAQRHGDLLTGRGVNIVKADVAGKGTYYRVRIPSQSKEDAIQLCSRLKAAGGSCFVSK